MYTKKNGLIFSHSRVVLKSSEPAGNRTFGDIYSYWRVKMKHTLFASMIFFHTV